MRGRRLREQLDEALRDYESGHFGEAYVYGDDLDGELSALHEQWWALPLEFITAPDQETYELTVELLTEQSAEKRARLATRSESIKRKRR